MGSVENTTSLAVRSKDGVKFGKELREKEFLFDKDYLNLNHGKEILFLSLNRTLSRFAEDHCCPRSFVS